MNAKIVFMGSPDFALASLEALHRHFQVVGVVTQPDRPAGRGRKVQPPDVKILAEKLGLPVIQPKKLSEPDALVKLQDWAPDVIVVAAFGQILRESVLNLPLHGCVNVHASLLPRWRGASPVQAAILHDDITGVTIMKMDQGLDTGPILSQREVPIQQDISANELFLQLADLGAQLLVDTLPGYLRGEIQPVPQDHEFATYAPRLKKSDGELDFLQPAKFLARKVRAYNPWPGVYTYYQGQILKVTNAHATPCMTAIPGKYDVIDDKPALGTIDGILVLDEVQLAGRSRVTGEEFLRGAKNWLDEEEKES
jgi:methionyl-tRNA formyltransferase